MFIHLKYINVDVDFPENICNLCALKHSTNSQNSNYSTIVFYDFVNGGDDFLYNLLPELMALPSINGTLFSLCLNIVLAFENELMMSLLAKYYRCYLICSFLFLHNIQLKLKSSKYMREWADVCAFFRIAQYIMDIYEMLTIIPPRHETFPNKLSTVRQKKKNQPLFNIQEDLIYMSYNFIIMKQNIFLFYPHYVTEVWKRLS